MNYLIYSINKGLQILLYNKKVKGMEQFFKWFAEQGQNYGMEDLYGKTELYDNFRSRYYTGYV